MIAKVHVFHVLTKKGGAMSSLTRHPHHLSDSPNYLIGTLLNLTIVSYIIFDR